MISYPKTSPPSPLLIKDTNGESGVSPSWEWGSGGVGEWESGGVGVEKTSPNYANNP